MLKIYRALFNIFSILAGKPLRFTGLSYSIWRPCVGQIVWVFPLGYTDKIQRNTVHYLSMAWLLEQNLGSVDCDLSAGLHVEFSIWIDFYNIFRVLLDMTERQMEVSNEGFPSLRWNASPNSRYPSTRILKYKLFSI